MQKRYLVAPDHEFVYPADPVSLRAIRDAGGVTKLTDEARAKLKFKTVRGGDDCSDMPESSLNLYLDRGWVVESGTKKVLSVPMKETTKPGDKFESFSPDGPAVETEVK